MDGEPFRPPEAKALIRSILEKGSVIPTKHFGKEAAKDNLTIVDATNVLHSGIVDEAEWEGGAWRYRVRTARIVVIVQFESSTELILITTWRNR